MQALRKEPTGASVGPILQQVRDTKELQDPLPLQEMPLDGDEVDEYPKAVALSLILLGICLAVFLVALDRTIITTAIPQITAHFRSTNDIGWYGSAYLLTASAFQPLYGRIFTEFNIKASFLYALGMFELGSLISALSPNSVALIFGRAVQGVGSAGIVTGAFVMVSNAVRLQKRPIYFAAVGILFSFGSLCGPLLGGVFTEMTTWRWCFYINLPIGSLTFVVIIFFFRSRPTSTQDVSLYKRILQLDLIGNLILLGAFLMLFLAFQDTQQKYRWSSSTVIGLLCGFGLAALILVIWQGYQGDRALLPPRIICQRTVLSSCLTALFTYGALVIHAYYLPIWFQAVKGTSAVLSGINMIPYMALNALLSLTAGILVSKNGLFALPAVLGCAIGTIGAGLLSTLHVSESPSRWIGYEILTSIGLGMAIQQGFNAVQAVLPPEDVPIGTAAVVACQSLGGAISLSVASTVMGDQLQSVRIPGLNFSSILASGATAFRNKVPASSLPAVEQLYNEALRHVFYAATALSGLAFLATLGMQWNKNLIKETSSSRI